MTHIHIEVAVSDITKHINHILKVIKGRKANLELEIYGDILMLIYKNIEMPIKILKPCQQDHSLKAKYVFKDFSLFFNVIKKNKDIPTIEMTFTDNSLDMSIAGTLFSMKIQKDAQMIKNDIEPICPKYSGKNIQTIFNQYGITNKMHNDAYDWQKKYWEISNEISGKNEWEDICIGFFAYITLWTLILFGLAFLDDKSNISQDLLAFLIIVVLLNIFFYLMGKQENKKKEEYKHKIESHKLEKVHHSEYEYKEQKLASDYETELKNLQSKIFRKRVSETFNDNLQKYNDFIDTCSYINHYLVFAHINTYEHREYAKKRGYSLVTNNYSSLSKKILPKIEEDYSSSKPIESKSIKSKFNPQKIDWLELNKSNAKLGEYGESIIIDLEKEYLIENGLNDLSEKVEWISKTKGDGAGYDIISYDINRKYKYIEVKTTNVSPTEPFYISNNELNFCKAHLNNYFIYRLYIDMISGTLILKVYNSTDILKLKLQPISYKAIIN